MTRNPGPVAETTGSPGATRTRGEAVPRTPAPAGVAGHLSPRTALRVRPARASAVPAPPRPPARPPTARPRLPDAVPAPSPFQGARPLENVVRSYGRPRLAPHRGVALELTSRELAAIRTRPPSRAAVLAAAAAARDMPRAPTAEVRGGGDHGRGGGGGDHGRQRPQGSRNMRFTSSAHVPLGPPLTAGELRATVD